jgi:two-component system NtrC family sensor kinase
MHRQIATIGRQKGIERVRLFNALGTITFSSDESEIGRSVDKNAEACYACHVAGQPLELLPTPARSRIYRSANGHRVLGMIRPIHNEPNCSTASCHAHDRSEIVLGVLDVNLSLAEADAQVARDQRRLILLALLAIAASSALLWWLDDRLVMRPVRALIARTRKVGEGDLHTIIPERGGQELSDLARAFNDMTQRLGEAQRQLTQAEKLASVGRLAAGVAHEINNPLTGVLTYSSLLLKRVPDPEVRSDLEVIVRETKRCREIVRGLLDFARQSPPRRQPTDLNEVVRHGVAVVMNQLALGHVSLKLDLAADLDRIPADGNQIQQVVVNLLLNAAEALGDSGGAIQLRTAAVQVPARGHAVIRVATCPKGCDLRDATTRISGQPGIRVLRRSGDRETFVHLDPVYGRLDHRSTEPGEPGQTVAYLCPRCRARLEVPEPHCEECGAPVFAVHAGDLGRVEWCARNGCHWTRWQAMEARGARPYAELEVVDSGRGIEPRDMERLFEPFFTTKGNRGTGLGLAVTWGIVEGHDGTIDVQSAPGETRFRVRLPYADRIAQPEGEADRDATAGASVAAYAAPRVAERGAA